MCHHGCACAAKFEILQPPIAGQCGGSQLRRLGLLDDLLQAGEQRLEHLGGRWAPGRCARGHTLFYVRHVARDLAAARTELGLLEQARAGRTHYAGGAHARVEAFIAARRAADRGLPRQPPRGHDATGPSTPPMAPNERLIALTAGVSTTNHATMKRLLRDAGADIGYEDGGVDTLCSAWPATGRPWRGSLNPTLIPGNPPPAGGLLDRHRLPLGHARRRGPRPHPQLRDHDDQPDRSEAAHDHRTGLQAPQTHRRPGRVDRPRHRP